jgi:hypothetical protein
MKTSALGMPALAILFALAACSEPSNTQMLASRVTASLDPAQPCHSQASIEYLPNGTRIRLPSASLFVRGRADLTACGQYALASVTEAMLDPRIMQVVVEPEGDVNAPASALSLRRADTVRALLSDVGFTSSQPPVLVQPATGPAQDVLGIVLAVAAG